MKAKIRRARVPAINWSLISTKEDKLQKKKTKTDKKEEDKVKRFIMNSSDVNEK